jgi:hypothetical protein
MPAAAEHHDCDALRRVTVRHRRSTVCSMPDANSAKLFSVNVTGWVRRFRPLASRDRPCRNVRRGRWTHRVRMPYLMSAVARR